MLTIVKNTNNFQSRNFWQTDINKARPHSCTVADALNHFLERNFIR